MKGLKSKHLIIASALVGAAVLARLTVLAPLPVETVRLESRDLSAQVYGNGTVEAKVLVTISSKITGRILKVHVDQGDRVTKGQLLARLESDDFTQQLRQAEATLEKTLATQRQDVAILRKAIANLELARKNSQRYDVLVAQGVVSMFDADKFNIDYHVAQEELNRAQAALEADRKEEAAARAGLAFAKARLEDTEIHAPQDGLIVSRDLEEGAVVTPGQSIYKYIDPLTLWVKANVDESLMSGVSVGDKASITLRCAPGKRFDGVVARIGRESDRVTEESEVDVAFTPAPEHFRLGEQSDVYIRTAEKYHAPSLPASAVANRGKTRGVWLVKEGVLRFQPVVFGIEDQKGYLEVRSGLNEGERVAVAPPETMARFKDGMKVRVAK